MTCWTPCDGVMVARGDLGLELPLEQVPRVQKAITRAAQARGLPVIVATQVFESMRVEPRPTRAEVSDAANAVDDRVDAIMLSGETAVGAHPARTVETLDAVIRDAEAIAPRLAVAVSAQVSGHGAQPRAVRSSRVTWPRTGVARAIVAVTRQGKTARVLSAFRPQVPIIAATSNDAWRAGWRCTAAWRRCWSTSPPTINEVNATVRCISPEPWVADGTATWWSSSTSRPSWGWATRTTSAS